MWQPLLDKLEPMAMMEDGGVKKALISLNVLKEKAADAATAAGIAACKGGVKILMQTSLLHPEPAIRLGAIEVLAACVAHNDAAFLDEAINKGAASLPAALMRLCSEEDRKAKPAEQGGEAIDPDLPGRRVAVTCLASLLVAIDPAISVQALSNPECPGVVGIPYMLLNNSDVSIRRTGAALLATLLTEDTAALPLLPSLPPTSVAAATPIQRQIRSALVARYAVEQPEKAAAALANGSADADVEVAAGANASLVAIKKGKGLEAFLEELSKLGGPVI